MLYFVYQFHMSKICSEICKGRHLNLCGTCLSQMYTDVVIYLYRSDGRIRDFGLNLADNHMVE